MISRLDPTSPVNTGRTYYSYDLRGSVTERLASNANAYQVDLYDGPGNRSEALSDYSDPWGFGAQAGYYTDLETGLILCTHRFYDPYLDRFVTRDPIGYAGGINLYGYCQNDPVNGIDPSGHNPIAVGVVIIAIGGGPEEPLGDIVAGVVVGTMLAGTYLASKYNPDPDDENSGGEDKDAPDPTSLTWKNGPPNGTLSRDNGPGDVDRDGQIRDYGPDGYPSKDFDFGHDHNGAGDPHCHNIGRPSDGSRPTHRDRSTARPISPNE